MTFCAVVVARFSTTAPLAAAKFAGSVRTRLGEELGLIDPKKFEFCWIVDFPMFEYDEDAKKVDFSHNPFSMPQGGLDALNGQDPLTIKAFQYDIACNGFELASGGIRNHRPQAMVKAFEIAGYGENDVVERFEAGTKTLSDLAGGIVLEAEPRPRDVSIAVIVRRGFFIATVGRRSRPCQRPQPHRRDARVLFEARGLRLVEDHGERFARDGCPDLFEVLLEGHDGP